MKIDLIGIILLIGAFQGFFLAFLIMHKGRRLYANRFLFILMLLYGLVLLSLWLFDLGMINEIPHILYAIEGIQFLIFPVYYLYAKYLEKFTQKFSKIDLLHFLPFLFYKVYQIPFFFMSKEDIFSFQSLIMVEDYPLQYVIFNWTIIIQAFIYLTLVIIVTNKYEKHIRDIYSSISKIKLDWLKNSTYFGLIITIAFLVENFLQILGIRISESFGFSSILAAVYIYIIGYMGLSRSGIFTELAEYETSENISSSYTREDERYERSGLTKDKAELYQLNLLEIMENQKPYKNNKLTLSDLASILGISSHNLSQIINTKENKNFFDFINQYRIDEVKKELLSSDNENLTILAIAMEAGFNSKTSFNTLFKRYVGMTPSEYRDSEAI